MNNRGPDPTAKGVAAVLRGVTQHLSWPNEDVLQERLARWLHATFEHHDVRREVILEDDLGRVDIVVGRVAIEVKVAGHVRDIAAQLQRYARSTAVDELVLVTTKVDHGSGERTIVGKPLVIVSLVGSAL